MNSKSLWVVDSDVSAARLHQVIRWIVDSHWYTRRKKEAIQIRLCANNINRDSEIDISEAWIPTTIKQLIDDKADLLVNNT